MIGENVCVVKAVDNGSMNGCTDLGLTSVGTVEWRRQSGEPADDDRVIYFILSSFCLGPYTSGASSATGT